MTESAPEAPGGGDAKVSKDDATRAWLTGVTAGRTGADPDACPYEKGTPLAFHWLSGFMNARR